MPIPLNNNLINNKTIPPGATQDTVEVDEDLRTALKFDKNSKADETAKKLTIKITTNPETQGTSGTAQSWGTRDYQEDVLAFSDPNREDNEEILKASSEKIIHTLHNTFGDIDTDIGQKANLNRQGSTASIGITRQVTENGNKYTEIITANLADAVSFSIILDAEGNVADVTRLNDEIHKPYYPKETKRLRELGAKLTDNQAQICITKNNYEAVLAVSRGFGDHYATQGPVSKVISSSPSISCLRFKLPTKYRHFVVYCSDGITDAVSSESKAAQENWVALKVKELRESGEILSATKIATQIVKSASKEQFERQCKAGIPPENFMIDNQTAGCEEIIFNDDTSKPKVLFKMMLDGHGGKDTALYVARNFYNKFIENLKNVFNLKNVADFNRDHPNGVFENKNIENKQSSYKEKMIYSIPVINYPFPVKITADLDCKFLSQEDRTLTGSALKKRILEKIEAELDNCPTFTSMVSVLEKIMSSKEYTLLNQHQNGYVGFRKFFNAKFSMKTNSQLVFENMIQFHRYRIKASFLHQQQQEPNPAPSSTL